MTPMYLYKYDLYRGNNDDSYYVVMRKIWFTKQDTLHESPPQILAGGITYDQATEYIEDLTKP